MTIQDQITQAAQAAGVPPQLALNIAQRESSFDNSAIGAAGEIGIFQLMPSTAAQLGVDPTNPTQNIAGGVAYIAQMLAMFGGNVQMAAAAFNCGPGCVQNAITNGGGFTITINGVTVPGWFANIPASTQAYVTAVTGSLPVSPDTTVPGASTSGTPSFAASATPAGTPPAGSSIVTDSSGTMEAIAAPFDWEPFAIGGAALLAVLFLGKLTSDG